MITLWHNRNSGTARCVNTERPLTHSLDLGEEGLAMQATRTCTVDGCNKPTRSRSATLCQPHYMAQWRYGDPLANRQRSKGTCTHPGGCTEPHVAKGLCSRHYARLTRVGILGPVEVMGRDPGPTHNAWKGDEIPYQAAHSRVRRLHGPACKHSCRLCGQPAEDWAYDHDDPNEKHDERGLAYSTNPAHYMALCRKCHYEFDRGR